MGGTPTTIEKYPYMVTILGDGKYCGGTIIHPFWVLTAYHCPYQGDVWYGRTSVAIADSQMSVKIARRMRAKAGQRSPGWAVKIPELGVLLVKELGGVFVSNNNLTAQERDSI